MSPREPKHVFIAGVCGTFMAGVALLARELGMRVRVIDAAGVPSETSLLGGVVPPPPGGVAPPPPGGVVPPPADEPPPPPPPQAAKAIAADKVINFATLNSSMFMATP